MRLEGKTAIVSGAARGIGMAIARRFAEEGAKVVIGDVLEKEGEATVEELRGEGYTVDFVRLDVTDEESWQGIVGTAEARHGSLNVLVNNAGLVDRKPILEAGLDQWGRVMGVNITGVFLGTKHAVPALRRAGGGSIINICSAYGLVGTTNSPAYSASKGGVRLFTKSTALEFAGENIRANSIHPGYVQTPMTAAYHATPAGQERLTRTPLGRFATPEDVANGALFLASDDATYMTGSELVIDGGLTAR